MSTETEKHRKRNGETRGWIQLGIGLLVLLASLFGVWLAASNQDAKNEVRIEHVEERIEKLDSVPADIVGIRTEQQAQRFLIERIDRRLEAMSKPK